MILQAICRPADEQERHRFCARVLKRVRVAARDEHGIARRDLARFIADGHAPVAAENVIDLFGFEMMMPSDFCACGQDFFRKAATLDFRSCTINERAYLGAMRRLDDGGLPAIYHNHFNDSDTPHTLRVILSFKHKLELATL